MRLQQEWAKSPTSLMAPPIQNSGTEKAADESDRQPPSKNRYSDEENGKGPNDEDESRRAFDRDFVHSNSWVFFHEDALASPDYA